MRKYVAGVVVSTLLLAAAAVRAQELPDFHPGVQGDIYFAPRLDLVPADQGGPVQIELDGILEEPFWDKAAWHGMTHLLAAPQDEDDANLIFAAAADGEFLYVAWQFTDDVLQNMENFGCGVWEDDSIEVYIDAKNDGPDCTTGSASCYLTDDAQLTFGVDQAGKEDPELIEFGGVAGSGACDFAGPHPELSTGVIRLINEDPDDYIGWQGEVAIALETLGNNDDLTPEWAIESAHQTVIGFGVQFNDDDDGGTRDHKATWAAIETTESSWRNPGAFGKLMFLDPTQEPPSCLLPVKEVACPRAEDGSVEVTWVNPEGTDAAVATKVLVDDREVAEVAGDAESVTLTAEQVPDNNEDHVVSIVNCSEQPVLCTVLGSQLDECGGFRLWNILGGFLHDGGAAPGEDTIRLDYMTDGEIEDLDFEWAPGAEIETDIAEAASTGIDGGPRDRAPGGVPTVFSRFAPDSRVNLISEFGGQLDNIMAYAQVYITVEEPMEVYLGVSSDDSIQIFVDSEEVWINNVGRGGSTSCTPQDQPDIPVFLDEGTHNLMLKVFNGTGGWDFTLRLQGERPAFGGARPITEGFTLSLTPPVTEPVGANLKPGDANGDGAFNISDPVAHLNSLFGGAELPGCYVVPGSNPVQLTEAGLKVLDFNGDAGSNIADAVAALNRLFGGGGPHVLGEGCAELPGTCEANCAQ